jgi:serine/threonine-protein kinase
MTAVCIAILQDEPASITDRRPEIPSALEAVVFQAFAKAPVHRFASIAELAEALHPFASTRGKASVERVTGTLRRSPTGLSLPAVEAATSPALPVTRAEPVVPMLTSTTWGDIPPKTRSNKGTAAVALVALLLLASGLAFYVRAKATTTGAAMVSVPDPPQPSAVLSSSLTAATVSAAPESPSVAAPQPSAALAPALESAQTAGSKVPSRNVPPKPPRPPSAPPAATTAAATTAPASTASAPALWNGRK